MIIHDENRCIGCKSCVIACADAHNLPADRFLMEIDEVEEEINGELSVRYVMKKCSVCKDKACRDACLYDCISFD